MVSGGNDQISTYMLQEGIAYYNAVLDELEVAGVLNKARIMMFNDRQLWQPRIKHDGHEMIKTDKT